MYEDLAQTTSLYAVFVMFAEETEKQKLLPFFFDWSRKLMNYVLIMGLKLSFLSDTRYLVPSYLDYLISVCDSCKPNNNSLLPKNP
jgi:hypothetical protein